MEERVFKIVKELSGNQFDPSKLDYEGDIKSQLNLDSIRLLELFSLLEDEFEAELPLELINQKRVGDFMDCLKSVLN